MKTTHLAWISLALLAAGCTPSSSAQQATAGTESACAPAPRPGASDVQVEVRILGLPQHTGFEAYLLQVRSLEARAGGRSLPVSSGDRVMDLVRTDHAWLAGRVAVPPEADVVEITLQLDDFGAFELPYFTGPLDARGPEIRVAVPAEMLARNGHVVLAIDPDASFQVVPGYPPRPVRFVPHLQVRY